MDTIAAIATAPGIGGIGIVRVSGSKVATIAQRLTGKVLPPRQAIFTTFKDHHENLIDEGVALFFPNPNSFTGEDVLEIQGHGGPVVLDTMLSEVLHLGARLANPGEFSQRAFLNDKIDLTQAEAIADLIESGSKQAMQSALKSLKGEFSAQINQLLEDVIYLRMYVESAIDFPEEEIDFLADGQVKTKLTDIIKKVDKLLKKTQQGTLLKEGFTVVLAGQPNAGKSSLLNALTGENSAIVTDIPGTTRDSLNAYIQLDGLPLHIIDTAGIRQTTDPIEQEGVKRATEACQKADYILLLVDGTQSLNQCDKQTYLETLFPDITLTQPCTLVINKTDLMTNQAMKNNHQETLFLSVKNHQGLDELKQHLKEKAGFITSSEQSGFIARRRHLDSIKRAQSYLMTGLIQLTQHQAGELLAADLTQVQHCLNEITGEFTNDDLLGKIFSSFCIGK